MNFVPPANELGVNDFKSFLVSNNIIGIAAAMTIGIASAGFIKSFVSSVLMPAVYLVIGKIILQNVNSKLYKGVANIFGDKAEFDFDTFVKELLTWVFIIIGAYLIMDFVVRRWLLASPKPAPAPVPFHVSPTPILPTFVTPAHAPVIPTVYTASAVAF
jgi:large-conductance mechanosensitive channel